MRLNVPPESCIFRARDVFLSPLTYAMFLPVTNGISGSVGLTLTGSCLGLDFGVVSSFRGLTGTWSRIRFTTDYKFLALSVHSVSDNTTFRNLVWLT